MTDNFIDRCANAFGKVVIIEWTGIYPTLHASLMDDAINFIRRDSRTQRLTRHIQNFPSHATCVSQPILPIQLFGRKDANGSVASPIVLFRIRNATPIIGIIGFWDSGRYRPFGRKQGRPKPSRKLIGLRPSRQLQAHLRCCIRIAYHPIRWRFPMPARGNLTLLSGLNLLCQGMNGFMRFVVILETILAAKVSWRQTHLHTFGTCQSL
mmetsp:Transcript_1798/g.3194  ORF Transcript_1798/g.3194 Transcript_1798/m.3194 type:complete len:209 (+) Transcript_1798:862-1488(+)